VTWLDETIATVRAYDAARPRSRQAEIGWSEVGGCRARLGYRLGGEWPSDAPDTWAAQRGTAIHEYLQRILAGDGVRAEVATCYRDIPGRADLVDAGGVTDIKTTRLASARTWATRPASLWPKRVQAHGYAAGLIDAGELPAGAAVRILVVPVDGTFSDWWCYEEPFDRALADEGADRLAYVRTVLAGGGLPPRDEPWAWCTAYCEFFSLCRAGQSPPEGEPITDVQLAEAVIGYGEASEQIKALDADRAHYADLIRGLDGTAGGWQVSMTKPGEARRVLDEDQVLADYTSRGLKPPWIDKPATVAKLQVRRVKTGAVP
jgi:hypothetical protein